MTAKKQNKKLFVMLLIVGVVLAGLLAAVCLWLLPYYQTRSFSLEDYADYVSSPVFYEESHLGKIDTASEARKAAVKVFREVYAEHFLAQTFPYIVSYDSKNDVWLVQAGKCFVPEWGAHIIINASDGEILGLWNYKF